MAIADRFTLTPAKSHVQQRGRLILIWLFGNMGGIVSYRLIMYNETVGFTLTLCCGIGRERVHDGF